MQPHCHANHCNLPRQTCPHPLYQACLDRSWQREHKEGRTEGNEEGRERFERSSKTKEVGGRKVNRAPYLNTRELVLGSERWVSIRRSSLSKAACLQLKGSSHKVYSPPRRPPPLSLSFNPLWKPPFASFAIFHSYLFCCTGGRTQSCQDLVIPSLLTARSKSASLPNAGLRRDAGPGSLTLTPPLHFHPHHRRVAPLGSTHCSFFPQELPWAKRQLCSSVA